MDIVYQDPAFAVRLKRDLAVLTTLAHLGCADFHHLHALCFPTCVAATARVALANLVAAGCLTHSRWMLKRANRGGGQVWTMTPKGRERLHRYVPLPDTVPEIDLGRPSTALEYDAWQARMDACSLIVALILEARRTGFLAGLCVTLACTWPNVFDGRPAEPDGRLAIAWHEPAVKPRDWLPWPAHTTVEPGVPYTIYLDRVTAVLPLQWLETAPTATEETAVPVLVLHTEERCRTALRELQAVGYQNPIRLTTWEAVATGVGAGRWRDGQGRPCALAL